MWSGEVSIPVAALAAAQAEPEVGLPVDVPHFLRYVIDALDRITHTALMSRVLIGLRTYVQQKSSLVKIHDAGDPLTFYVKIIIKMDDS